MCIYILNAFVLYDKLYDITWWYIIEVYGDLRSAKDSFMNSMQTWRTGASLSDPRNETLDYPIIKIEFCIDHLSMFFFPRTFYLLYELYPFVYIVVVFLVTSFHDFCRSFHPPMDLFWKLFGGFHRVIAVPPVLTHFWLVVWNINFIFPFILGF